MSKAKHPENYPFRYSSFWSWHCSYEIIKKRVSNLLSAESLPIEDSLIAKEAAWHMAKKISGQDNVLVQKIPLVDLQNKMAVLNSGKILTVNFTKPESDWNELNQLQLEMNKLLSEGETELHNPLPSRDRFDDFLKTAWVWDGYSDEQLIKVAETIYSGALDGYKKLVETWFNNVKDYFVYYQYMPVRLVGYLLPRSASPFDNSRWSFSYYFEALPKGSANRVEISFEEPPKEYFENNFLNTLLQKNRQVRANTVADIYSFKSEHGLGEFFTTKPATELAYEWLKDDLKRINLWNPSLIL